MKNARVLVLFAVTAVGACHGDSDTSSEGKPLPKIAAPAPAKKGPSVAEQTVGMVEAATQGKSNVPVELKFDLVQKPQADKPLDINIAVMPQISAEPVVLQITAGDGLALAPGFSQIDIPSVDAGAVYRHIVKLTPTGEGVLLLGLTISLKHDEVTESRVFSIPLIVDR